MKRGCIQDIDKEFEALLVNINSVYGLPPVVPKIISALTLEGREMSLEEISKKTGYSLSTISTNVKNMEMINLILRVPKSGTKKVYVRMHKSWQEAMYNMFMKMYEIKIEPVREAIPGIIEKYSNIAKRGKCDESELAQKRIESLTKLKSDLEFVKQLKEHIEKCRKIGNEVK
ncbi:MAG: winged helix-turn-helix transcriptional regulator [Candidatus Micrarchaeia archaeon]